MIFLFYFFVFKQKTAYEMRISDWSSDVCSSDLIIPFGFGTAATADELKLLLIRVRRVTLLDEVRTAFSAAQMFFGDRRRSPIHAIERSAASSQFSFIQVSHVQHNRSEEHTSELQSLMRISYAVYCLKKKKKQSTK